MKMVEDVQGWVALAVGNSRLHWATFVGSTLQQSWDTPHLSHDAIATLIATQFDFSQCPAIAHAKQPTISLKAPALWLASVVPAQIALWQTYPNTHTITLSDIPIGGLYPTLGIDRALALLGALKAWGSPVLVIDAGTALTLTGANSHGQLVGGAIMPGLQLQMRSLSQKTAALPLVETQAIALPPRWATNTPDAIRSGVFYSTLAGISNFVNVWLHEFPKSAIALTGGDGSLISAYLNQLMPQSTAQWLLDPHLVFWGIRAVRALAV